MVTVKDMRKLYKKIEKAENAYDAARWALEDRHDLTDVDWYMEKAQNLHKACRALKKVADNLTTTMLEMMLHTGNEDEFIRWMILTNIEMVNEETDEENEETEEKEGA